MHTSAALSAPSQTFAPSPIARWWFQPENKKVVDGMLAEEDQASTVESEEENIRKKCEHHLAIGYVYELDTEPFHIDLSPKNPVVFCHGLLGFDIVEYWDDLPVAVLSLAGYKGGFGGKWC